MDALPRAAHVTPAPVPPWIPLTRPWTSSTRTTASWRRPRAARCAAVRCSIAARTSCSGMPPESSLVHRRTDTKDIFPGAYDVFAGGVCAAGESYDECARREVAEELGVVGADPMFLFKHRYRGPSGQAWGCVYEGRWDGAVRPAGDRGGLARVGRAARARSDARRAALLSRLARDLRALARGLRRAAGPVRTVGPAAADRHGARSRRAILSSVSRLGSREVPPMAYRIISADCHIDMTWMPGNLWVENAPASWRDQVPQVRETPDGPHWYRGGQGPRRLRRPRLRLRPRAARLLQARGEDVRGRLLRGRPAPHDARAPAQGPGHRRHRRRGDVRHPRDRPAPAPTPS